MGMKFSDEIRKTGIRVARGETIEVSGIQVRNNSCDTLYFVAHFEDKTMEEYERIEQNLPEPDTSVVEGEYEDEGLDKLAAAFGWAESSKRIEDVPGVICEEEKACEPPRYMKDMQRLIEQEILSFNDKEVRALMEEMDAMLYGARVQVEPFAGLNAFLNQGVMNSNPALERWAESHKQSQCKHEWVDTGFRKSWCRHCNTDKE